MLLAIHSRDKSWMSWVNPVAYQHKGEPYVGQKMRIHENSDKINFKDPNLGNHLKGQ